MTPELQEFANRFLAVLERMAVAMENRNRRDTMKAEPKAESEKLAQPASRYYGQPQQAEKPNAETRRPRQASRS